MGNYLFEDADGAGSLKWFDQRFDQKWKNLCGFSIAKGERNGIWGPIISLFGGINIHSLIVYFRVPGVPGF